MLVESWRNAGRTGLPSEPLRSLGQVARSLSVTYPLGLTRGEIAQYAHDHRLVNSRIDGSQVSADGAPATIHGRRIVVIPDDWRDTAAGPEPEPGADDERSISACILIASKNGEATIGRTIDHCTGQADVYVVSDGSTDDTVGVADRHGATVMDLAENVGKPTALRAAYHGFRLGRRYDAILILDDDTRLDPDFIAEATALMTPEVAVVCGETRSDWLHDLRWNGLVATRALAYWRYGLFLKQGQHVLNAITVIPGSNSLFRTSVMTELIDREVRYIVDDTQWLLDIQTEKMGRVVYARQARAYVQDPTTLRGWYTQTLRWLHGTMQGIRGHRIGRTWSWFSATYSALILDWFLYVVVWPLLLAFAAWQAVEAGQIALIIGLYAGGFLIWSVIGAIAVKNWRLPLLWPVLIGMDWVQRAVFVHAFVRAWREPTSECKWESPARHDTRPAPAERLDVNKRDEREEVLK